MLPKNLNYGNKVESAMARSYRSNISPQNGTGPYTLGDTVIFNIPTRSNLALITGESYLKFRLQPISFAADSACRFDSGGAHGLISRIKVYHGSNMLQDINEYGMLAKMLFDIQVPSDATYGKYNITSGTRNDLVMTYPTITTPDATANGSAPADIAVLANALKASLNTAKVAVNQVNSGELIKASNGANIVPNTGTTATYDYCINLISLIGSLNTQNYLPLFEMTSSPLRVEITLVDSLSKAFNIVTAGTLASGLITNVEYVANFIELSDEAISIIRGSLGGQPLQFVFSDYRSTPYSATVTKDATTNITFPINAKYSSLKSIFVTTRDVMNTVQYFPFSSVMYGLTDYTFRVGSQIMPAKSPTSLQEMFCEVMKAIGNLGDLQQQPSIEKFSYSLNSSVVNTTALEVNGASNISSGSFYIGLDLENYPQASKDNIFAGWNSLTDDIYLNLNYTTALPTKVLRWDAFSMFDSVFVCENNTAYVKF